MAEKTNNFKITLKDFHVGASPAAHLDILTESGGPGAYSDAQGVDVHTPKVLQQGPALADLTNGNQAGVVDELIRFILDKPPVANETYGISTTKLHKINPTDVVSDGTFPHPITDATEGSSVLDFQGALYYFFNKASGGDIGKYDLASSFTDNWGSSVPATGSAAIENAPHPVAKKQDIMLFGNGRYVGTYVSSTDTLSPHKLDFGVGYEVADVAFHANQWWLAVNSGVSASGNRASSQIYLYDGAATSAVLADEVAVGVQRIGFILPINGIVFVAYQDVSGSYAIGYVSSRRILPLAFFTGGLPTFAQKTLYKNFVAFLAGATVVTAGAITPDLPYAISNFANAGYATVGAIAAPFGDILVASNSGSDARLAKLTGYDDNAYWTSIIIPLMQDGMVGYIDFVTVRTRALAANAQCDLLLFYNQQDSDSGTAKQITGENVRRHTLDKFPQPKEGVEDFCVYLEWPNSAGVVCPILEIEILGHYIEKP
ncbi:hypothetical protein [Bradyrhizobium elkanii]|uniref:hypothetical protein n=1 Tax=Bradyrhizobium elkanii TaxID=29448 RepID=UPI003D1FAB0F